jgi:hypothetical protein
MRRKEVWLAIIFVAGLVFCIDACQSDKSTRPTAGDANAVFAQGGASSETGGTPAGRARRRGKGQSQSQNPGAGNE